MKNKVKQRKGAGSIAILLLFVMGISITLYPMISNSWNQWRYNKYIKTNIEKTKKLPSKEKEKELSRADLYNKKLVGSVVPNVFAVREEKIDAEYDKMLNVSGNGIMGSISIPSVKINLPIYHYASKKVLEKGAGHLFGSSLPVGGIDTHAVITAHRGLPQAKLFTDLDMMKMGKHFYIDIMGKRLAYKVDKIQIVKSTETRSLAIKKGKDYVTLVTCTPYGVNTKRLLVRGHRVPYKESVYNKEQKEHPHPWKRIAIKISAIFLGLLLALIVLRFLQKIKH